MLIWKVCFRIYILPPHIFSPVFTTSSYTRIHNHGHIARNDCLSQVSFHASWIKNILYTVEWKKYTRTTCDLNFIFFLLAYLRTYVWNARYFVEMENFSCQREMCVLWFTFLDFVMHLPCNDSLSNFIRLFPKKYSYRVRMNCNVLMMMMGKSTYFPVYTLLHYNFIFPPLYSKLLFDRVLSVLLVVYFE